MRAASWLFVPLFTSGCVLSGLPISPYGREVRVHDAQNQIRGELIAVASDTLWVLQGSTLRHVVLSTQHKIVVRRHNFTAERTMRWMLPAGAGTGAALLVACRSYERSEDGNVDAGCVEHVAGTMLSFAAAGLIFGGINAYTAVHRLTPADSVRLRAYSRYPQGLPEAVRAGTPLTAAPR